jgi:hypothetical protein
MNTIKANSGLKVKTGVRAAGLNGSNHNRAVLKVRTGVKAAGIPTINQNRAVLKVGA